MSNHFKLENLKEVKQFEKNLSQYCEVNCHFGYSPYLGLEDWYKYCIVQNEIGGKIFTSILDMKFHFIFLDFDMVKAIKSWERIFKDRESVNIIEDYSSFEETIKILEHFSNYVLRYRAIWDKLMGLIVLLDVPEKSDSFRSSKSRKKSFRKLCNEFKGKIKVDGERLVKFLEDFDNEYRTPEAHGTGKMRKWILDPSKYRNFYFDNPSYKLTTEYWNTLIYFIGDIEIRILNKKY